MIDYKQELKKQLETILPCYYELFTVDWNSQLPFITYQEVENSSEAEGDTIRFSNMAFYVKIWGENLAQMSPYRTQVDKLMFDLNFKRTSYRELAYDTNLCMILRYECLAYEKL